MFLTACSLGEPEPVTITNAYNATVPDFKPSGGEILGDSPRNNVSSRTTRTTGHTVVIGYGNAKAEKIDKWMEKNPAFPDSSPLKEKAIADDTAFPKTIGTGDDKLNLVSVRCYSTPRLDDYSTKNSAVIEVYAADNKKNDHATKVVVSRYENSLGCPDAEYETIKHLVGKKGGSNWADVANNVLDILSGR